MRFKLLVLTAILAIGCGGIFVSSANAQDGITPYAWIDVFAGYVDKSKEYNGTEKDRDFTLQTSTPANTKFGLKGVKGNLTTVTEVGFASNHPSVTQTGANWKDMYANLKVLDPSLKASIQFGRYSLPSSAEGFNPIMDGLDSSAMAWEASGFASYEQNIMFSIMGFYVALAQPLNGTANYNTSTYDALPKVAVGYVMPMPMKIGAHFVAQQLTVDDGGVQDGETILSYQASVTANMFMPFGIIHGTAWYSQNAWNMGVFSKPGNGAPGLAAVETDATDATKFADTTGFGGNVGVMINIGNISPTAGVGYESYDNDNWTKKDTNLFYFAGVAIKIDPTTTLYPGIKVNDYQKDSDDVKRGKIMWYGAELTARI